MQERPFPDHLERKGKAQVMMISTLDEEMAPQPEDEEDLDQRASKVQGLFKFKNFYDQMDLNLKQRIAITKAIMKLTDSTEGVTFLRKILRETTGSKTTCWCFMKTIAETYQHNTKGHFMSPLKYEMLN